MIRLWVNDIDYGTMSEKAGQMYAEVARRHGDICRLEPVGEDEPDFLPKQEDGIRVLQSKLRKTTRHDR